MPNKRVLGHVVGTEGMATDPAKVEAVRNGPIPRNVSEVHSFLARLILSTLRP